MLGKANFHAEIADDITMRMFVRGLSAKLCEKTRRVSWKKLAAFKIELVIFESISYFCGQHF